MSLSGIGALIKNAAARVESTRVTISSGSGSSVSIVNGKVYVNGVEQDQNGASAQAIGSGPSESQHRAAADFSSIAAGSVFQVFWTPGEPSIEVRAPAALLPLISTEIDSAGELSARVTESFQMLNGSIEIHCSSPALNALSLSGSAQARVADLVCDAFEASLSGSAQATVSGSARKGAFQSSGSSQINAKGFSCSDLLARSSGSSRISAFAGLSCSIEASGSSSLSLGASGICAANARLSGSSELSVDQGALSGSFELGGSSSATLNLQGPCSFVAQGGSKIRYTGEPQIASSKASAGASVEKRSKKDFRF